MLKKVFSRLLSSVAICLLCFGSASAKNGYKITLKFTDIKDSFVYLAHYYGKPLPTIYKSDSTIIDKNGVAVLRSDEKILGGIYIVLLSDKKTYFDFLLDNGDDMTITITTKELPNGLKFTGSKQNSDFIEYTNFLNNFGMKQQALMDQMGRAKTAADSAAVNKKSEELASQLYQYRIDYVKQNPGALLGKIFNALALPQVPQGKHYLPDGKVDSEFAYRYYKSHYWDDFDFKDDRLVNAPIYDAKLDEYMNKLVLQYEDSVIKESDMLLNKTKGTDDMFHYTLWWLTHNSENSKVMGMDAVFVHLVENYYMKGDATWLKPDELQKYITAARKIAPNVIGNLAPEIKLKDVNKVYQSLHGVKSKYTLLLFWSPDCGHCKAEIPKLDSVYKAVLKPRGVKVYAVSTYDDEKLWKEFIKSRGIEEWTHVWDPEHEGRWRDDYNVYMTPILYLLDDKKIIRGKRIDYSNIAGLVEMLDKKEKNKTKTKVTNPKN
ncbi:MAG: DUF5106 domain-containing protein [Bacteroidetes bacterium]|nr:DUF5106 domain-containing protein [Bacteroidota bacterium]